MSDRIRISDLRAKTIVGPSEWSITRFAPFVELTPDERDALVDAVVEFRRYLADTTHGTVGSGMYGSPLRRAHKTLARFDFGESA